MQQCSPHKKVQHPRAGVLSLDTAGPLIPAYDQGGCQTRYFLVGTLTWAVPLEIKKEVEDEVGLADEVLEGLPEIEEAEEEEEDEEEEAEESVVPGGADDEEREDSLLADLADAAADAEAEEKKDGPIAEDEPVEEGSKKEKGPPKDFRIGVYRLALPMQCKKAREVTKTVMEMILRLRMDGYHVNQVHTSGA